MEEQARASAARARCVGVDDATAGIQQEDPGGDRIERIGESGRAASSTVPSI